MELKFGKLDSIMSKVDQLFKFQIRQSKKNTADGIIDNEFIDSRIDQFDKSVQLRINELEELFDAMSYKIDYLCEELTLNPKSLKRIATVKEEVPSSSNLSLQSDFKTRRLSFIE